jgi:hypothetical protein
MSVERSETLLLLGEAHTVYDRVTVQALPGGASAGAITAGCRPDAPWGFAKVDRNEDGLLVRDDGRHCLLAVADAHYGRDASHALLEGLAGAVTPDVAAVDDLLHVIGRLGTPRADPDHPSETTLLVLTLDRQEGAGFGVSYGDSTAAILDPTTGVRVLNEKTPRYVTPARPSSLRAHGAVRFRFRTRPGQLLVAFTDGVDECHYGRPQTSIRPHHLRALLAEVGAEPEGFARRLLDLALRGVDGHPGGEDNAAVAVARA